MEILKNSGLDIIVAESFDDAARKVVAALPKEAVASVSEALPKH